MVALPFASKGFLGTTSRPDVWSRLLHGGRTLLLIALLSTILGMVVGIAMASSRRTPGWLVDEVIMRLNDVTTLAFPQILLSLVVLTSVNQPRAWMIVVLVGISHGRAVARVARGPSRSAGLARLRHAAEALGERRSRVILAEVLPNMNAPLLAEAGLRLTYSITVVAGLGFLGFSTDRGAANWGQMINENRLALSTQTWAVLAPVLVIGLFCVGTNLVADGIAQVSQRGGGDQ